MPGYDCPAYADYLDVEWHQINETYRQSNSICIFEYTADSLLSRHTAQYSVTVSRNTYLIVRSVSTVGNYDYTISYLFYLVRILQLYRLFKVILTNVMLTGRIIRGQGASKRLYICCLLHDEQYK